MTYTPSLTRSGLQVRCSELPEVTARRYVGFFSDIRDHQLDETSDDMEALLGRSPASLKDGLRELFDL